MVATGLSRFIPFQLMVCGALGSLIGLNDSGVARPGK
jgi:hypothetical protein